MSLTNIKMCHKVTILHPVTGAGENEQINGTKIGQEKTKVYMRIWYIIKVSV